MLMCMGSELCCAMSILSVVDMICLACTQKLWCMSSAESVCMVCWSLSYVVNKILLLLNMADMD